MVDGKAGAESSPKAKEKGSASVMAHGQREQTMSSTLAANVVGATKKNEHVADDEIEYWTIVSVENRTLHKPAGTD